jgi:hypothetical protein
MDYLLIAMYTIVGYFFANVVSRLLALRQAKLEAEQSPSKVLDAMREIERLPLVYLERVTDSSGTERILVYNVTTNHFVCQGIDTTTVAAALRGIWPDGPIYIFNGDNTLHLLETT